MTASFFRTFLHDIMTAFHLFFRIYRQDSIITIFILRRDSEKADTSGVHFDPLHFIVVWEGYLTLLKSQLSGGLFEILKMFYPSKGLCIAECRRRYNCFYLCFNFGLGNVYGTFNITLIWWSFFLLENILSPDGTLHSGVPTLHIRVPKEVQLFLLMIFS